MGARRPEMSRNPSARSRMIASPIGIAAPNQKITPKASAAMRSIPDNCRVQEARRRIGNPFICFSRYADLHNGLWQFLDLMPALRRERTIETVVVLAFQRAKVIGSANLRRRSSRHASEKSARSYGQ